MLTPGGAISTVAGTGTGGFSGDGGPATAAALSSPSAVAVDAGENIYIADTGNNRVRLITPDGNIATIAGAPPIAAIQRRQRPRAARWRSTSPGGARSRSTARATCAGGRCGQQPRAPARHRAPGRSSRRRAASTRPSPTPPACSRAPLAPGEIVSIFSSAGGLGPDTAASGVYDANGMLSTTLGGVQVLLNGTAAPLFYVQANQINAQVPYEMAGQTSVQVQVTLSTGRPS